MFGKLSKVITYYIYWDFTVNSAWGFLSPVFAIFVVQNVATGSIAQGARITGFATLAYWVTKAILQMPIATYLDKNHGEIDDFWFYFIGSLLTGLVPFGFLFSSMAWQVYVLQIIHAVGMSMVVPSANAIFVRHIDKGREAYETGLNNTLAGIGVGVTGAAGGVIAGYFGFQAIFILTGVLTLVSTIFIFAMKNEMQRKVPRHIHKIPGEKSKIVT